MARPKPLDSDHVLQVIRNALGLQGQVLPSRHIVRDSMPKRSFDMNDVINVLDKATTVRPSWNTNTGTWNYDVKGRDLDGNELTIRIVPNDDDDRIVLVTGF